MLTTSPRSQSEVQIFHYRYTLVATDCYYHLQINRYTLLFNAPKIK